MDSSPTSPILGRDFINAFGARLCEPQQLSNCEIVQLFRTPPPCEAAAGHRPALRANLFRQQIGDEGFLFLQFILRRGDLGFAEIIERHALDNLKILAVAAGRIAEDQTLLDAVAAVGMHADAEPVAGGRRVSEFVNGVHGGVGRAGGAAQTTRLDDGRAALLHGGDEIFFQPFAMADDLGNKTAVNLGVVEIRIHRSAMVAPNGEVGDGGDIHAGLLGELGLGAIFIERGHGEETILRNAGRVVRGDERIGVARIADDEHANVARGVLGDGIALAGENFSVDAEKVFALHALLARHGADEQRPVHALEAFVKVRGRHETFQERERTVVEFHADAMQRSHGFFIGHFDEVQDDRLVRTEGGAGSDAEEK